MTLLEGRKQILCGTLLLHAVRMVRPGGVIQSNEAEKFAMIVRRYSVCRVWLAKRFELGMDGLASSRGIKKDTSMNTTKPSTPTFDTFHSFQNSKLLANGNLGLGKKRRFSCLPQTF